MSSMGASGPNCSSRAEEETMTVSTVSNGVRDSRFRDFPLGLLSQSRPFVPD